MILKSITEHIGNTPLLLIPESVHNITGVEIYAKLEYLNPFGSLKDRTALSILKESNNKDIIESSSGNTAKALGILTNLTGQHFTTITNRIKQKEVEDILRIIGVDIENLPPGSECPDPYDPNSPFGVIQKRIIENPGRYYWTDQYTNKNNPKIHHDTTAREIESDIGIPDFFFSGLGTTGSSRGIIEYFDEKGGDMQSIGIITTAGSYIPGIRNSHEMEDVGLFMKKYYARIIPINDQDAIDGMLALVKKCGMIVGPTTGAVYHGILAYLRSLDPEKLRGKKIVFIACDRMEPYTSYIREKRPAIFVSGKEDIQKPTFLGEGKTIRKEQMKNFNYLLVDMRSYKSYDFEHIPGSISFPFSKLQEYLTDNYLPFPKETPLLFICPFGEESMLMSQIANGLGYESYSLEGGLHG